MTDTPAPISFGPYLLVRASAPLGGLEMAVRTDVRDPEVCVLKRLPIRARSADAAARFRRHAHVAARLEHENIARTLRVETIDGQVCVARELVEGVTLSKVMRALGAQPAPLLASLYVVHEIARGLAYAHDHSGVSAVHGEVTPENVMIAFSGYVKLIDFGISRPADDAAPPPGGVVVGHRGFLPPEAAPGGEPTRAADIYALGVVLWELLTGRRADDEPDLPLPNVATLNPDVPEELARLVTRATALAPEARPRAADELGAALTTFWPAGVDPQQETAALVRRCFDVDLLQPLLASDMAAAKRLATGETDLADSPRAPFIPRPDEVVLQPAVVTGPELTIPRVGRRLLGGLLAATVAAAVVSAGVALLQPRERPAPAPAVAVVPTAPPPLPAAPPPPPEPAPAEPLVPPATPPPRASRGTPPAIARTTRDDGAERLLQHANELFERGNTSGALAGARQAVAAGAGAPAHVLMATLLINLQNYKAAEPELTEALRLDPRNDEARRLLALIRTTAAEQASR